MPRPRFDVIREQRATTQLKFDGFVAVRALTPAGQRIAKSCLTYGQQLRIALSQNPPWKKTTIGRNTDRA